jgi:hypothetical protein
MGREQPPAALLKELSVSVSPSAIIYEIEATEIPELSEISSGGYTAESLCLFSS